MNANLIAMQKMAATGRRTEGWQPKPSQGRELNGYQHDRETIVALGSDSLDRRGTDAGLGGEQLIEPAYPLDIGIVASGIDYPAVAYNVIDDDETSPRR